MARYVKKYTRIGSLGPTEERGFALWAGYELVDVDGDFSEHGLLKIDDWPEDRIAALGITTFARIEPDDLATYEKLGIRRTNE